MEGEISDQRLLELRNERAYQERITKDLEVHASVSLERAIMLHIGGVPFENCRKELLRGDLPMYTKMLLAEDRGPSSHRLARVREALENHQVESNCPDCADLW